MHKSVYAMLAALIFAFAAAPRVQAQDTEERFHDLFVTAGYSTAFGAALGAAVLGLTDSPASNIRYIYAGASLGFIGGSILGTYVIFSPMLISGDAKTETDLLSRNDGWTVSPHFDTDNKSFTGAHLGFKLSVN